MSEPAGRVRVLIATGNRHKVLEMAAILGEGFQLSSLADWASAPRIDETAATFEGNAALKASGVARWLVARSGVANVPGLEALPDFVLADDSGLEVEALDGAPGVMSARFAADEMGGLAGNAPDAVNNRKLLRLLAGVPPGRRGARFRCVLALVSLRGGDDTAPRLFEGVCGGRIAEAPTGAGGFGYDPLFVPDGHEASFGSLPEAVKHAISHRSAALRAMRKWLECRI